MRSQPKTSARSTSASRRGDSEPFSARKRAVQSSRRPIVQGCSVRTVMAVSRVSLRFGPAAPREPLFLVEFLERRNQFVQVPGNHAVEAIKSQVDAVVGDAILREVVGADTFAAVAGADEGAPLLGALAVQGLLLAFVKPASKDAHRPFVVLVLAALVLALDFEFLR